MNLLNLLIITGMQIGDLDLNHQPLQPNESTCQKAGVIGYIYLQWVMDLIGFYFKGTNQVLIDNKNNAKIGGELKLGNIVLGRV
jgi:hypothetical protein